MEKVSFDDSGCFNSFFLDYINQEEKTQPLVNDFFSKKALQKTSLEFPHRKILVNSLKNQYQESGITPPENIEFLLNKNCHTVTTGHQLSLFTGPLYFHYKIMSTIKLAESLSTKEKKVIPIFWMATEDHDFEEINHFHVGDKTYRWNSNQKGAVGEFVLDDMEEFFKEVPEEYEWMKRFYRTSKNLAEATRKIVHHLYGDKGIIILDANRSELKTLFLPKIKDELLLQTSFNEVMKTNLLLSKQNYKIQVNPREINLFYKSKGIRERILKTEIGFEVNNSTLSWTSSEFNDLIEKSPELISPNVILRPVYQQTILPNIAYIGGPGELIYWLQLKTTHKSFGAHFPILVPRDHVIFLENSDTRKIKKLKISNSELFQNVEILKKNLILTSSHNIEISSKKDAILKIIEDLQKEISNTDFSLNGFMEAEKARFNKEFNRIQKKVNKAVSRIENEKIASLEILMNRLQPANSLQERRTNFLSYHLLNPNFLNVIFKNIDPFVTSVKIITDE